MNEVRLIDANALCDSMRKAWSDTRPYTTSVVLGSLLMILLPSTPYTSLVVAVVKNASCGMTGIKLAEKALEHSDVLVGVGVQEMDTQRTQHQMIFAVMG